MLLPLVKTNFNLFKKNEIATVVFFICQVGVAVRIWMSPF